MSCSIDKKSVGVDRSKLVIGEGIEWAEKARGGELAASQPLVVTLRTKL